MPDVAVVCDHEEIRALYENALKHYDNNVLYTAKNGPSAPAKHRVSQPRPELVAIDDRFSGEISGLETLRLLLGEFPGLRINFITEDDTMGKRLEEYRSVIVVVKPIEPFMNQDCKPFDKVLYETWIGKH